MNIPASVGAAILALIIIALAIDNKGCALDDNACRWDHAVHGSDY
jgi:hypothetical protein